MVLSAGLADRLSSVSVSDMVKDHTLHISRGGPVRAQVSRGDTLDPPGSALCATQLTAKT